MPHSIKWAKRLLRELPEDPAILLRRRKSYADATFFPLFFDYLEGLLFDDPQAALEWTTITPDLAQLVPEAEGPEGRREHRCRLVKAWAISGGAQLACGHHAAAENSFNEALKLIESEVISSVIKSEVYRRLAFLRACQRRLDEALKLADEAVEEVRGQPEKQPLALAMACRGYVLNELRRFSEAIQVYGKALALIDPKESDAAVRIHLAAVVNLAYAISSSPRHADHTAALSHIRQAREMVKGGRRFVPRYRLLWVEGLVWAALGLHARAETAFKVALEGFEALKLPFETALVKLDLGAIYAVHEEWEKLLPLAAEAFQRFRVLSPDTEAIAAVSLWADAVKARTLTDETTSTARLVISARIAPGGCCKLRNRSTV